MSRFGVRIPFLAGLSRAWYGAFILEKSGDNPNERNFEIRLDGYGKWNLTGLLVFFLMICPLQVQASNYLAELQVANTCGTTYADKLVSCTPFRCQQPSPLAMLFGFPSEEELQKVPAEQQQKMKLEMADAEKKMAAMSPEERAELKAKMMSTLKIKGFDAQGRCQTTTLAVPGQRLDCIFDKDLLPQVSAYAKLAAQATEMTTNSSSQIVNGKMVTKQTDTIDGKEVVNPMTTALNNGQCQMMNADADLGWISMAQWNQMAHFELKLSEHGKPVDGHIQIRNSADGSLLFDKEVNTSHQARKINLQPGTFDIKIMSVNPQSPPVSFQNVKLRVANVFRRNIEFYAISGTLELAVKLDGKPSKGAAIYIKDPDTQKWLGKWKTWEQATYTFSPAKVKLPETLSGRYQVFVAAVPSGMNVPHNATYKNFLITIKKGETIEKKIDFGVTADGKSLTPQEQPQADNAEQLLKVTRKAVQPK